MELVVMPRVIRRTVPAAGMAALVVAVAACAAERSYDNPPEVRISTATSSTAPAPTTTVFVPSTAPTTLAPPTTAPAPTAPPTAPPTFAPQTAPPTQPTIP